MSFIQNLFLSRDNNANSATYVGQQDRIWWDPGTNAFYYRDGSTPGGIMIGAGGSGNGVPGGPTNSIQINAGNGSFAGTNNLTFDGTVVSLNGNVSANYFIGDGSQLTNLPGLTYGNSNVAAYLPTYTGNVTANYFIGDGSLLTGLPATYGNSNVADYLSSGSVTTDYLTSGNISASGNVSGGYAFFSDIQLNDLSANAILYTDANRNVFNTDFSYDSNTQTMSGVTVSLTGNITANYIIGDGSQLTNLPIQPGTYGNANVANYLPTYTGNLGGGNIGISGAINAVGEITTFANIVASPGGYFLGDGSQLTNLPIQPGTYGNSNVSAYLFSGDDTAGFSTSGDIAANTILADSGFSASGDSIILANLSVTGNVYSDSYFIGDGAYISNITGANVTGLPNVTFDTVPPTTPVYGDIWIDANSGVQYLYYNDVAGNVWAEMEAQTSYASVGYANLTTNTNDTQVLYNSANVIVGSNNLTFDGTTLSVNRLSTTNTFTSGNIIPGIDNAYYLGNSTNRWANIFLGPGTLYITDSNIASNATAELTVLNGVLQVNGVPGLTANLVAGSTTVTLAESGNITLNAGGGQPELVVSPIGTVITGNLNVSGNIYGNIGVISNVSQLINGNTTVTLANSGNITMVVGGAANAFVVTNSGALLTSTAPTNTNLAALDITGNIAGLSLTPNNPGVMIHASGLPNNPSRIYLDSIGANADTGENSYPAFIGRAARGSVDTPSQILSGDIFARFGGNPYNLAGFNTKSNTRIDFVAAEDQTEETRGTQIEFWNTPPGSNVIGRTAYFNSEEIRLTGTSLSVVDGNDNSVIELNQNGNIVFAGSGTLSVNGGFYVSSVASGSSDGNIVVYTGGQFKYGSQLKDYTGNIGANNISATGNITLSGLLKAPLTTQTATSPGTVGQICWDANYIYVCTATNTWKRSPLTGGF